MGKRAKQNNGGKMEPTKEVSARQTSNVASYQKPQGFFSEISARDVSIPKILPLHYMSEKVKDKNIEAKAGEMRDTVSNELFGDTEHPFEFIPLGLQKWWVVTNKKTQEYIGKFPVTRENENQELETDTEKRVYTMEYMVMIPKKIAEMGTHVPYVLSFRITSLKAGKTLATTLLEMQQSGLPAYYRKFKLSVKEASNDKGDFFVQTVTPVLGKEGQTTAEEREAAKRWVDMLESGAMNVKVDDSDYVKDAEEVVDPKFRQF